MNSTDLSGTETVFANVRIERAITKDHFDGRPWPPLGDGWRMVRTLDDWRHEWRRISLADGCRS
jgi:hypothetical protein